MTSQTADDRSGDIPTDGQLLDQLEAALEKLDDGYVCQDVKLRKELANVLARFNRVPVDTGCKCGQRNCSQCGEDPHSYGFVR